MDAISVNPDGETLAHSELARILFVSKNLLRLQGLYVVAIGLAILVPHLVVDTVRDLRWFNNLHRVFYYVMNWILAGPLALGLSAWVNWYYKRTIGFVYYSRAQVRAVEVPLLIWVTAGFIGGLLILLDAFLFNWGIPRPPVDSILLLNLTFGLGLLAQWWVEGRKRQLFHYLLVGAANVGVSALATLGFQLETTATAFFGRPQPFFDYFTLGASLLVLGLCDHRLLTRHLKTLPAEPS